MSLVEPTDPTDSTDSTGSARAADQSDPTGQIDEAERVPSLRRPTREMVIVFAAVCALLTWTIPVIRASGRGFDLTDEGFYLLSYRWWNQEYRTFTGVQFLYGPVFDFLGWNIARLRLFRLATVLGTTAIFAWSYVRWLRPKRPTAPSTRWWDAAVITSLVAASGMVYTWLPASPGYNDVSLLGALLLTAIVIEAVRRTQLEVPVAWWLPAAFGLVSVGIVLAKWASAMVTIVVVLGFFLLAVGRSSASAALRLVLWAAAGALGTLVLLQLFIVDFREFIPELLSTNSAVAASTNSVTGLASIYWSNLWYVGVHLIPTAGLVIAAAVVAVRAPADKRDLTIAFSAVTVLCCGFLLWQGGSLNGGSIALSQNQLGPSLLLFSAPVIAIAARAAHRTTNTNTGGWLCELRDVLARHRADLAVLGLLAIVPFAQAAGTGNGIFWMALGGFACWAAIIAYVVTDLHAAPPGLRVLAGGVLAGALIIPALVGRSGAWELPYRNDPLTFATERTALEPLSSITVERDLAAYLDRLGTELRPWTKEPGRRIMAFDEMAGLVFALDGRSVGEPWYSSSDTDRTAEGIRDACADGPPWGDRLPIVIADRPLTSVELKATAACGLDLEKGYSLLESVSSRYIQVFVPLESATADADRTTDDAPR